jgi:hypothetical protein
MFQSAPALAASFDGSCIGWNTICTESMMLCCCYVADCHHDDMLFRVTTAGSMPQMSAELLDIFKAIHGYGTGPDMHSTTPLQECA